MTSEVEKSKRAIDDITGIYIVKPIRSTWLKGIDPNHSGAVMFDYAVYSHAVERHYQTGLAVTGLTDVEARELESEMNLPLNSLSPYNLSVSDKAPGKFSWGSFSIKIPKEGLVIDASRSALEKLQIKVLMAGSKVAKNTLEYELNPSLYDLIIISQEAEAKAKKNELDIKKKAYAAYSKMSLTEMIDFLSVYEEGKFKVSASATPTFIDAELGKIVDTQPEKFIATLESPYFKSMLFLFKCVNANLIYKQGPKYVTSSGDLLGNSLLEAVTNLQSNDYQPIKISLLSKLEGRDTVEPKVKEPKKSNDSTDASRNA